MQPSSAPETTKRKKDRQKITRKELLKLSKTELAKQCRLKSLSTTGKKLDLINRLIPPKQNIEIKNAAQSLIKIYCMNEHFINRTKNKFLLQQEQFPSIQHNEKHYISSSKQLYLNANGIFLALPLIDEYEMKYDDNEHDTKYYMMQKGENGMLTQQPLDIEYEHMREIPICAETQKLCIIRRIPDEIGIILNNKMEARLEKEVLDFRYPKRDKVLIEKVRKWREKVEAENKWNQQNETKLLKKLIVVKNENNLFKKYKMRIQTLIDPSLNTYLSQETYHSLWIPSIFNISNDDKVGIKTDINNLSKLMYSDLYNIFAAIFKCMLPMFEFMVNVKQKEYIKLKNIDLKVIVKMQNYELYPNEMYEGPIHREGYDEENIVAVGIYYYYKSSFIEDDILEISRSYQEYQQEMNISPIISNINYVESSIVDALKQQIHIKQGDCLVFNNRTPIQHQLLRLKNSSSTDIGTRKILSFLLIDPRINKIKEITTEYIQVNRTDGYNFIITYWYRRLFYEDDEEYKNNKYLLPLDLVRVIIHFIYILDIYNLRKERNIDRLYNLDCSA